MKKQCRLFSLCAFMMSAIVFLPSVSLQAAMGSATYRIESDVVGSSGDYSSSTNYRIGDTTGEAGANDASSASGWSLGGFWRTLIGEKDSDHDGLLDVNDNCPNNANPDQQDSDHDGVGDVCDNCQDNANGDQQDSDHDGVGDECDNCQDDSNADQKDGDHDGVGDECDNCKSKDNANQNDADSDGVGDECDNCATVDNANQNDSNGNSVGDACEPPVEINDTDSDGILNNVDNCPNIYNPEQKDTDGDAIGDACDNDSDNDGIADASDNCPIKANADQADDNHNGIGNACDTVVVPPSVEPPIVVGGETLTEEELGEGELTQKIEKAIANVIQSGLAQIGVDARKLEAAAVENGVAIGSASTAVAAASIAPVLLQLGSIKDIVLLIYSSIGSLFGFIFRRRRDWGIAYDLQNNVPIPLASVSVVNAAGRILDRRMTDKFGSYSFLVPPGEYTLNIERTGYRLATDLSNGKVFYADNYTGGVIKIDNPDLINFNIPLLAEGAVGATEQVVKKKKAQHALTTAGYVIASIFFYAGFLWSIFALIVSPQYKLFNLSILVLYIITGITRRFALSKVGWGQVIGEKRAVAPFTTIRVTDNTGKLVARTIADEFGRYSLILRKGKYSMEAIGVQGDSRQEELVVKKVSAVKKNILLMKAQPR